MRYGETFTTTTSRPPLHCLATQVKVKVKGKAYLYMLYIRLLCFAVTEQLDINSTTVKV